MGTRRGWQRQQELWVATATLARPASHPFYERLNRFRLLMIGYFEGIDSERGIAWRGADSLGIRAFLGISLDESVPDQTTISRTRRLIDIETHQTVFSWILSILAERGLLRGKTKEPERKNPTPICGDLHLT